MAFRFGHQITCNINKNLFIRSSSAEYSRRYKSVSPISLNRKLKENRNPLVKERYTNLPRARSLPSPEDSVNLYLCQNYSSKKQSNVDFEESTSPNTALNLQTTSTSGLKPRKIKLEEKSSNVSLQPSNLTPVADSYIGQTSSSLPESSRSVKIDTLRQLANAQYEKAVKALNQQAEDESYRYQLESARPRTNRGGKTFNVYQLHKEKFQARTRKVPQLQPKNIKPYGNINTLSWSVPNVEYFKQSGTKNKIKDKYKTSMRSAKRGDSDDDVNKNLANHFQQRDYCTVQGNAQSRKLSPELEKCKTLISEYKKINPDYIEKKSKLTRGSEEEKEFVETTEKFISNFKNNQQNNEIQQAVKGTAAEAIINSITTKSTLEEIQQAKQNLQDALDFTAQHQTKVNLQSNKGNIILYYEDKCGNKVLCSKIVKKRNKVSDEKDLENTYNYVEKESKPIKIKIGPKLMLQSSNLKDDEKYQGEELTPAANEKFIAPWLSWGDRIKLNSERIKNESAGDIESTTMKSNSTQDIPSRKAHAIFFTNIAKDISTNKSSDIQKREFSLAPSLYDPFFRKSEVLYKKTFSDCLFSTNSTRGVLGPEGTVMVKLRRLPKINIPEPPKVCPVVHECFPRADGVIKVKQKKLPKLIPVQCVSPSKVKMKEALPLARPKSRSDPKEPPRECPEVVKKCSERADHGLEILPKKLPKIVASDCFPCSEHKMKSPSLPRLKARPIPPSPPTCEKVKEVVCSPRADEGLKALKKKLPPLKASDCCPICSSGMTEGEPLKRLRKVPIHKPAYICIKEEITCPPRADEVSGYKVKKKKLQTLILSERNNNISWKEFNSNANNAYRNYTTYSKHNMCCYSDKKVHPDMQLEGKIIPSEWDKFDGLLLPRPDGKIEAHLPPKEIVDNSTGSELKIIKKPIGTLHRRDEHLHEELLKSGFTTFINNERKFSCTSCISDKKPSGSCYEPPEKPTLKDLKLRRVTKRKNFYKDFPRHVRYRRRFIDPECDNLCRGPRMDDIMKYEVKAKSLPILPKGKCLRKKKPIPKTGSTLLKRLKKKMRYRDYECPKRCVVVCPPRADSNLVEVPKKLPPLITSNCPKPSPKFARDDDHHLKRLPKYKSIEEPRCPPVVDPCVTYVLTRADADKNLYERKSLPVFKPIYCPRKPPPKLKSCLKLLRLPKPKHPCKQECGKRECIDPCPPRSDIVTNYQVKKKKLKTILKSSNKSFSTLPDNYLYRKNFFSLESDRYISTSTHLLNSNKKECKKLIKNKSASKCPKYSIEKCKPAKSISCKRNKIRQPCAKQKSPYPAFSECKDHDRPDILTECKEGGKYLQPKWPILSDIRTQEPPPPHQGKIDPSKQEECIAKRLNITLEGDTKLCDNFDKSGKPLLTKEMYDEVMKNPPYDECECANKDQKAPPSETKGPCKPVDHSICETPEIECSLNIKPPEDLSCHKGKEGSKHNEKEHSSDKPKLICKKKSSNNDESRDHKEEKMEKCQEVKNECKEEKNIKKEQSSCKTLKKESRQEVKSESKQEKKIHKQKCEQPKRKKCEPPSQKKCQSKKKESEDKKSNKDKGDQKGHCRNVKTCKKKSSSKNKYPEKCSDLLKDEKGDKKKSGAKKPYPKKCSDLLKEDKVTKKKTQVADLCAKTSSPLKVSKKVVPLKKVHSAPSVATKCPPKSFLQRILDFFRARPNCPPPDQWKKDKLKKQAEEAAAAAGYELCEKKKPKLVKVVCKKTGVKSTSKLENRKGKPGKSKDCKKFKSTCTSKKKSQKKVSKPKNNECSTSKSKKVDDTSTKKDTETCKIASVTKAKECPVDSKGDCIEEKETDKGESSSGGYNKSGKTCKLPRQKYCKPPGRKSCKQEVKHADCTAVESPYPSFSECKTDFPKLPISECSEQEKNLKRKSITFDYDDPKKGTRNYSTSATFKRYYSSNANRGRSDDPFSLFNSIEDSLTDMENNELALRILAVVKDGIESMALSSEDTAKETYYKIFKELETLCEQELSKNISRNINFEFEKYLKEYKLSDTNLSYKRSPLSQRTFSDLEQTIMIEAINNFCKVIFSVPDLSTKNYEESERIKTEKLQKQLDKILDNYKDK